MRTTLDIDDDLLAAAKELSRQQGRRAGQVVSNLLRRVLADGGIAGSHTSTTLPDSVGSFRPFVSRGLPVTNDGIDALRDREGS